MLVTFASDARGPILPGQDRVCIVVIDLGRDSIEILVANFFGFVHRSHCCHFGNGGYLEG